MKIKKLKFKKFLRPHFFALFGLLFLGTISIFIFSRLSPSSPAVLTPAVAHWAFDEGTGQSTEDRSGHSNVGTLGANSTPSADDPTWISKDLCVSDKCLQFTSADSEYVNVAGSIASVNTISFWVRPTSVTSISLLVLNGAAGNASLTTDANGVIQAGAGFSSPTIYINGDVNSTLTAYNWQHVLITTSSDITASNVMIGRVNTGYFNGFIDEVKLYDYAFTATQVNPEFATRGGSVGSAAEFASPEKKFLSDGLIGYWNMDETTADTCADTTSDNCDKSGNGHDGAWNGNASAGAGKFGNSVNLDGSGDYVNAGSHLIHNISLPFTISTWINIGAMNREQEILSKYGLSSGEMRQWMLGLGNNNVLYFYKSQNGTTGEYTVDYDLSASQNIWRHIGITGNSSGLVTLYIDGQIVDTDQLANLTIAGNATTALRFGSRQAGNYFLGRIDDTRIYNRLLSDPEMLDLYNFAPGPVGQWQLNENSGTDAYDSSGYGNTLTLTNSPSWSSGRYGSGISFPGANAHLLRADDSDFDFFDDSSFTIQTWFKLNNILSDEAILSKYNEAGYKIFIQSDGNVVCGLDYDASWTPTDYAISTAGGYDDGAWHHVACVKNSASSLNLYVDGALVASDTSLTAANSLVNSDPLYIGVDSDGASYDFTGTLDEISIYNYPRSQNQIISDLNAGHPAPGSPVGSAVAHWKFDNASTNVTYDSSMNSQHLTLFEGAKLSSNGKFDHAVELEKDDSQFLSTPDSDALSITGNLTLSAWINPESTTASTLFSIAGKWDPTNADYLLAQYGDEIRMYIGSASNYVTTNSVNLQTGVWYHVVGVYNASAQTVTIYVNSRAQPATTTGTIPSSISDTTSNFTVGALSTTPQVDEVITANANDGMQYGTTWFQIGDGTNTAFGIDTVSVHTGLRFETVNIPASTSITSAYLQVYSVGNIGTITNVHAKIVGDYSGDAAAWSTDSTCPANACPTTITNPTTAQIDWDPTSWTINTYIDSPDITSIIDEIRGHPSWVPGTSDLRLAIVDDGSVATTNLAGLDDEAGVTKNVAHLVVNFGGNDHFDGLIDEVKVYADAFSLEQVTIEYNQASSTVWGNLSTDSTGLVADNTAARQNCIPGDTTTCSSPVGDWKLDERTGLTAFDSSGNSNNGTLSSGLKWTTGRHGAGVNTNISNGHISMGDPASGVLDFGAASDFTIQAWVKTTDDSNSKIILDKNYDSTGGGYRMRVDTNGHASCGLSDTTLTGEQVSGTTDVADNTWHHVACVINGSAGTPNMRLYVDGKLDATFNLVNSNGSHTNSANFTLSVNSSSIYFRGSIDEARVYNYARSLAQISWDYNRGAPQAWYRFDECSGTTAQNSALNSHGKTIGLSATIDPGDSTGNNDSVGDCSTPTSDPANSMWYTGASGRRNGSLGFDGTNDQIYVNDNNGILSTTNGVSLSAWIYAANSTGTIVYRGHADGNYHNYRLDLNNGNLIFGYIGDPFSIETFTSSNAYTWTDGWHHVAVSFYYDSIGNVTQLYRDGVPISGSWTSGTGTALPQNAPVRLNIGERGTGNHNYFTGLIDEVKIYNYPLTPALIKTDYNAGAVNFGP